MNNNERVCSDQSILNSTILYTVPHFLTDLLAKAGLDYYTIPYTDNTTNSTNHYFYFSIQVSPSRVDYNDIPTFPNNYDVPAASVISITLLCPKASTYF